MPWITNMLCSGNIEEKKLSNTKGKQYSIFERTLIRG